MVRHHPNKQVAKISSSLPSNNNNKQKDCSLLTEAELDRKITLATEGFTTNKFCELILIDCSYCGSNTGYDDDKKSKGYWYSLVTRDNKTCLYFVCSNCYAKQTDKYLEWNPIIINTKSQNRNELEHKTKNFCHNPILT
jgi:hypothetical protein